jgi:hypothetical protein
VLNFLGKGQQGQAFAFFKPANAEDRAINGEAYHDGTTGAPILDAHAPTPIEGRPDEAGLHMNELGDNVFCGG